LLDNYPHHHPAVPFAGGSGSATTTRFPCERNTTANSKAHRATARVSTATRPTTRSSSRFTRNSPKISPTPALHPAKATSTSLADRTRDAIASRSIANSTTAPRKAVKQTGTSAADFLPRRKTLATLRAAAKGCRGCELYACATGTVFGEGPSHARLMLVGEVPGDVEDREGRVFVGPAGKLLDRALEAAGIDRDETYLTNAVKHFKWAKDARSERRLHKTPNTAEVRACFPWLESEIAVVKPRVIVCLGATAAKAVLGRDFSVMKSRGRAITSSAYAETLFATVHPSAVLRSPREDRADAERAFIADLRVVAKFLARPEVDIARRRGSPSKFDAWPTSARRSVGSRSRTRSSPG
jgi:uracil-DNA glycosylase family protein